MKTKIIPFDLETAKKIQSGEVEGRIVTKNGGEARILAFDSKACFVDSQIDCYTTKYNGINKPLVVEYLDVNGDSPIYQIVNLLANGKLVTLGDSDCDLVIELPEEASRHEFKPFDRVLVRDEDFQMWSCSIFSHLKKDQNGIVSYNASGLHWNQCIPYKGNEDLVGTTKNPKED